MHMQIIVCIAVAHTQLITHAAATVFYHMYKMIVSEKRQGTEYPRLIQCQQLTLKFGKRHRPFCGKKRPYHQYPVCRGTDAMRSQ